MGGSLTKSPLERRNTILRRSQRKSVHHIRSRADNIMKDIRRFNGVNEDDEYIKLKDRIELLRRELEAKRKDIQPQIMKLYNDVCDKLDECHDYLEEKLNDNKKRLQEHNKNKDEPQKHQQNTENDFVIEEEREPSVVSVIGNNLEPSRKMVEFNLVQIQATVEPTPESKRKSVMKMGVPVMPGTIMEALNRKSNESNSYQTNEKKINDTRKTIEHLEMEISQFVGKRNGKYYNKLKQQLESCANELDGIKTEDDTTKEQIALCTNYVSNCLSFLDEKAVNVEEDDDDEVFTNNNTSVEEKDYNSPVLNKLFKITSI